MAGQGHDARDVDVTVGQDARGQEPRSGSDDTLETPVFGSFSVSMRPTPYKEQTKGLFSGVVKRDNERLVWADMSLGVNAKAIAPSHANGLLAITNRPCPRFGPKTSASVPLSLLLMSKMGSPSQRGGSQIGAETRTNHKTV